MQPEYFDRLSKPVQQFILEVEQAAHVYIVVIPDSNLNEGGPSGQGNLAITIKDRSVQLFAPTNEYFPDGAVLHEVLHVRRFHVDGVPKLVLGEHQRPDKAFSDGLGHLDNAIEHVFIVPEELQLHPERLQHWEAVMENACSELPNAFKGELDLMVCLHWTFLRQVLPDSPSFKSLKKFAMDHELLEKSELFANQFFAAGSKEEIVSLIFSSFPNIPKSRSALEYISSTEGTYQKPIP